jgi:hypothetical protein
MGTQHPAHARYAARNFLQLAFDCEPWAPTLPDGFVVIPNEFRKLPERLEAQCRSGNKKQPRRAGNLALNVGKNSRLVKLDGRPTPRKNPSGAVASDGESQRGSSTAPPIEMYHCAQEWKNSTVWAGTFPG